MGENIANNISDKGLVSKLYKERQTPYVFTLMWILRNLTEDYGGGEGKKKKRLEWKRAKA